LPPHYEGQVQTCKKSVGTMKNVHWGHFGSKSLMHAVMMPAMSLMSFIACVHVFQDCSAITEPLENAKLCLPSSGALHGLAKT